MRTEPLTSYLKGVDALKRGDRQEAGRQLARSVGIDKPTPIMEQNLDRLLSGANPNEAIMVLVGSGMLKKE